MMTLQDKCIEIGLEKLSNEGKISFDYAYPQDWANDVLSKTTRWPRGIVWLYDIHGILGPKCGIFGRPYPVTLEAWQILRIYKLSLESKSLLSCKY